MVIQEDIQSSGLYGDVDFGYLSMQKFMLPS